MARSAAALVLLLSASGAARATTFYVAPSGSDQNPGTESQPFATMTRGQMAAAPGDTVLFRGGTYRIASTTAADGIDLTRSGSEGKPIDYFAYEGETPVFDFSGMTAALRIKGIAVTASWIHLRGLELKGVPQNITTAHESWGIYNDGGSHNVYERLELHHHMGPGLFIVKGSDNLVLNCDSHHNYDPRSSTGPGTNADGFGCHVSRATDTGNVFRGCRAWWNSDDGFDLIQAQAVVVIEQSWAFYNGYAADSKTAASGGDGNGFKAGGYGVPATNVPAMPPRHVVRTSVAVHNRSSGFYQNHHPVSAQFFSDTAYDNRSANFNCLGLNGNVGTLRDNLAFQGTAIANGAGVDERGDSWSLPVTVSAADFVSMDEAALVAPRGVDGSLPSVGFLQLQDGSDLIDAGEDLGLPFQGKAPDLGAFEWGTVVGTGGTVGTGGSNGGGGVITSTGGAATETGGANTTSSGGIAASGGATSTAGAANTGGTASSGGAPATSGGDSTASGGSSAGDTGSSDDGSDTGCSCRIAGERRPSLPLLALVALVLGWRRHGRGRASRGLR